MRYVLIRCDVSNENSWLRVKAAFPHFAFPDWPINISNDWYPQCPGALEDWAMAEDVQYGDMVRTTKSFTWTYPYQAIGRILQPEVPHNYIHNLESVFWMLWLIMIDCEGLYCQPIDWVEKEKETAAADVDKAPASLKRSVSQKQKGKEIAFSKLSASQEPPNKQDNIPVWVKWGCHTLDPNTVAMENVILSRLHFMACINPYFCRHVSVRAGMVKLFSAFIPPPKHISHQEMVDIVKDMRNGIEPEFDRVGVSVEVITSGRESYQLQLQDVKKPSLLSLPVNHHSPPDPPISGPSKPSSRTKCTSDRNEGEGPVSKHLRSPRTRSKQKK
ncbi:hypothetical protein SERLA73DRAFT_150248 [Serpula lacrymans var. lacrymans S7.3]|uniref:Fungal-type protein kinase domain-containing protein n=1 Tax=Serpula lacrymans var. lacrymans (strain S7.3) TaxID=936435 RepID=F8PLR2_SERL3|nr:hypothetical protein SERLA73DRAFT_150248 [Serpula lacrymans var. lacrymans S7.3]